MIEQEADGGHIWQSIRSGLLSYMLLGRPQVRLERPLSDERIQMVFSLLGDLDKGSGQAGMPGTGAGRQT